MGRVTFQVVDADYFETDTVYICRGDSIEIEAKNVTTQVWGGDDKFNIVNNSTIKVSPNDNAYYFIGTDAGYTVGENLIVNGDFELGNTGFTSEYEKITPGNPIRGGYDIDVSGNNYYHLFSACGDHTTGSGKMFITDGSEVPNVKLWCQTITTSPNTKYEFAAHVTSIFEPNPPILQFSVNGIGLGSPFNVEGTVCKWQKFASTWESGLSTSTEICVVNQNTAGGGNDFAIDDISFAPVQQIVSGGDSILIIVHDKPKVYLGNDTVICEEETFTLDAGAGYENYKWSIGKSTQIIDVNWSGNYKVEVINKNGCTEMDSVELTVVPLPVVNLGKDISTCADSVITLSAGVGYENHQWSNGEITPSINVNSTGYFSVIVANEIGCSGYDTIRVTVLDTPSVEVIDVGGQAAYCFDFNRPKLKVVGRDVGFVDLSWFPRQENREEFEPTHPGVYTLVATNERCTSTYQIKVESYCEGQLFIPNAFTPNGDGQNDEFIAKFRTESFHVTDYSLLIYDRWGGLLFESKDPYEGWDGTSKGRGVQQEVYVYKLSYNYLNKFKKDSQKVSTGTVALIR